MEVSLAKLDILAIVGCPQLAKMRGQRPRRKESWKHKLGLRASNQGDDLECSLREDLPSQKK